MKGRVVGTFVPVSGTVACGADVDLNHPGQMSGAPMVKANIRGTLSRQNGWASQAIFRLSINRTDPNRAAREETVFFPTMVTGFSDSISVKAI